jgi:hypothetical protein
MLTLDQFIESITHEQDNIIKMGIIKGPNANALVVHEISSTSNSNSKQESKEKAHADPKKEGYSKPFDDSSGSKGGKGKKGKNKCSYYNNIDHPKSTCMKKQIDQMAQILQKNNLGDQIPKASKKKSKDQEPTK